MSHVAPLVVPSRPLEDPVLIFALAIFVFLAAPLLLERYRLPGIVGIILVGALVGPNALGLLERDGAIVLLGQVGVIYLMFLAGLEIDVADLAENPAESVTFGLLSFVIPQAVGTVAGVALLDMSVPAAALYASVFASHTLLAYPVVARLGLVKNRAITAAIGGTVITDTLALLVLAVVVAATAGALTALFWVRLAVGLALFFVGTWVLLPRAGRWFFRTVTEESYFEYLFVLLAVFVAAYAAELAGVEPIIGAFVAGLALNRLIPKRGVLMNRLEFVGNAIFIPFFLLSVGMLVDVRALLLGGDTLLVAASLVVLVLLTKYAAAWVSGRLFGYSRAEVESAFGLTLGQAAAALAVTLVGFEIGLFDRAVVNGVVAMILVISVVSPAVVSRAGRRLALAADAVAEPAPARRLLVPFSRNTEYRTGLLDLALSLRDPDSDDPIYTVTVVPPDDIERTEQAIASVEAAGASAGEYAAGAEVAVDSQTRVNHNVASGIAQAALENRISAIVLGWDGARSRTQRTFGSVIDRVLRGTTQLVVVARVRAPLNAVDELLVVLPPDVEHAAGFPEAAHVAKTLAEDLGATLRVVGVEGDPAELERGLEAVSPDVPLAVERADDFDAALARVEEASGPGVLPVCFSARRGHLGWHPELQTLPGRIAALSEENFAVIYPATRPTDDRRFLKIRE